MTDGMVAAHTEAMQLRFTIAYPTHLPRASDAHYRFFHAAHDRLQAAGRLVCWVGNADCGGGPIELHHDKVEYSLIADVDRDKLAAAYGLHFTDDEVFLAWVEQEGNLLPLCPHHHRGLALGIHNIPYPLWLIQKYLKAGIAAPTAPPVAAARP